MKAIDEVKQERRRNGTEARPVRFLRLHEVLRICGRSRSSIYDAISKGEFPRPVKIGANSSGWIDAEIEAWIRSRIEASRAG
jgi:prophage regulatory protein